MTHDTTPTSHEPLERIPVREGERFDEAAAATYLEGRLEGAEGEMEVEQFAGGHANLTYCLRFGEREYVLRRPPIGSVAASSHDMGREYDILSKLHDAYPLAPRAYLLCEDESVIGAPFLIMERRSGGVVVRRSIPAEFGAGKSPTLNREISQVLIDALADLHRVDYEAIGLGELGNPEGFMARQVKGWKERYERARTEEVELFHELARWLEEKLPESGPATVLHNDWRLDNMMLDRDDPSRVIAVFDWDMGTIGDPLADLGSLLSYWFEESDGLGAGAALMPSQVPGFMSRNEAIERYAARTGFDLDKIAYYHIFGQFKMAAFLQQIFYRYHNGQTTDKRFENFGAFSKMLIHVAYERAQKSGF